MDNIMIDTQNVIDSLQKIYKDKGLTQKKAYEIVHKYDPANCPSETTIARVFRKGAKAENFRWETTLRPVANAFLELEGAETPAAQAYKSILKLKKDTIDELEDELEGEKTKYHDKLEEKTTNFQKSLDFAKNQIALKDKRIDQLLDANDRLQKIIDRLTEQLLACPCRNSGQIVEEKDEH